MNDLTKTWFKILIGLCFFFVFNNLTHYLETQNSILLYGSSMTITFYSCVYTVLNLIRLGNQVTAIKRELENELR